MLFIPTTSHPSFLAPTFYVVQCLFHYVHCCQVVFKMCCAVVQISFSEEQRPAVERELTRILSKADFTIEHDVELFLSRKHAQRSAKEMYREAVISLVPHL